MQRQIRNFSDLLESARLLGCHRVAVVSAHDPDALAALKEAEELGLVEPFLLGNRAKIMEMAGSIGYRIKEDAVEDIPDSGRAAQRALELVRAGRAQLIMKGKINTSELIRAVLDKEKGIRTSRLLNQVIVLEAPGFDRLLLMTDAAINIAPGIKEKEQITQNTIWVAHALGIACPKVAMLTALEFVNPAMPATVDAAAIAVKARRGEITGAIVDGPIALDVPLSKEAAAKKGLDSPIAGEADIFINPNIEAANIMFRCLVYFAGARNCGVVVGAKVPLVLLSRAETPDTKLHSLALAILVAHQGGVQ